MKLPRLPYLAGTILLLLTSSCKKERQPVTPSEPLGICKIQYLSNGSLVDTIYYDDQFRVKRFAQGYVKLDYYYNGDDLRIIRTYPGVINSTINVTYDDAGKVTAIFFSENNRFKNTLYEYDGDKVVRVIRAQNESYPYVDTFTYVWNDGNIVEATGTCVPEYDMTHKWQEADLLNWMHLYEYGVPNPIKTKNLTTAFCGVETEYFFDDSGRVSSTTINNTSTNFWYTCL